MATTGNRGHGQTEQQRGHEPGQTGASSSGGLAGAVMEKASDVASGVASAAGSAWEATRDAASTVASTAGEAVTTARQFMGRYPLATFGAGVGVGVLLALCFMGRSPQL